MFRLSELRVQYQSIKGTINFCLLIVRIDLFLKSSVGVMENSESCDSKNKTPPFLGFCFSRAILQPGFGAWRRPGKYLIMIKIYHRGVQVYSLKHCL